MVNGQLLQMNKRFSQLKQKQQAKIVGWMYEAYELQVNEKLTNEEAVDYVYNKIEETKIWVPRYEVEKKYYSKKTAFKNRMLQNSIPKHIRQMEGIFEQTKGKIKSIEKALDEYEKLQADIKRLEDYYTSQQWKDDFELDEEGQIPKNIKRGVLSEDGIYNLLEHNKELMERIESFGGSKEK